MCRKTFTIDPITLNRRLRNKIRIIIGGLYESQTANHAVKHLLAVNIKTFNVLTHNKKL